MKHIIFRISKNILPGARVIPNISCEEPHGLIVTNNVLPNFERELAFYDEASFDIIQLLSQRIERARDEDIHPPL